MNKNYHLHINIFSISDIALKKLKEIGYQNEPFLETAGSYAPPSHYSIEDNDIEYIKKSWDKGLAILEKDDTFQGYIESEILYEKYSVKYKEDYKFNKEIAFPLPHLTLINVPKDKYKKADIHVKRTLNLEYDKLDELLIESNFYLVRTERHRLYTLQSESLKDMVIIFNKLKEYFDLVGGVKALTLEVVNNLVKFPKDFKVIDYLPEHSMDNN